MLKRTAWLLAATLIACGGTPKESSTPTDTDVDTDADADTDTDTDTDTDADTDTDTDTDTEPPGVTVTDASLICGDYDYTCIPELSASSSGPGAVTVQVWNLTTGCCPDGVTVDPTLSTKDHTLNLTWIAGKDVCDCICCLDLTAELAGVPPGTWTVQIAGETDDVAVK
jgi:hypothetical protein